MEPTTTALLAVAGLGAGLINSVLGGGTFLTFPTLVFAGIDPITAAATNTVALLPSGTLSAIAYGSDLKLPPRTIVAYAATTALGAFAGASLLLRTPPGSFVRLVPFLLLFATLVLTFGKRLHARVFTQKRKPFLLHALVLQGLIAIYGGYFGGGMGILMMAGFALLGLSNIHEMNGLRSILASVVNGVSVITFAIAETIAWQPAVIMAIASSVGGFIGARAARRFDASRVRTTVLALAWMMTALFMYRAFADG